MCTGSLGSTSLDSWKTSGSLRSQQAIETEFVFDQKNDEHDRWLEAVRADPLSLKHVSRYESCGSNAWIVQNKVNGHVKIHANTCKLRICPVCSRGSAMRIKSRLAQALQGSKLRKWRMITLTLKHDEETLSGAIQKLRKSLKLLRKTTNWRKYIDGGYAVLEITYNATSDHWHPHFHVVAGGRFYPWKELRNDWSAVSGGSTFTDIRPIKTATGAIHYLTSYLAKMGSAAKAATLERLTEFYRTIQGQRFLVSFGSAPPPAKLEKSLYKDDYRSICPLWQFIIALRDGEIWARCLSKKLHKKPLNDLEMADWHPPPSTA